MIFFFGRRTATIKKYKDNSFRCENCDSNEQQFSVYQEYFHLFFIPVFPLGSKKVESVCPHCNNLNNAKKGDHYLSITRTPFYLFSGLILFAILIITGIFEEKKTSELETMYIANPMVNDVYLFREKEEKSTIYYFMKIKNIDDNTAELIPSFYQYGRSVKKMDDSDYFVVDDVYEIPTEDLESLRKKSVIWSVIRDYDESSGFMIEKNREDED